MDASAFNGIGVNILIFVILIAIVSFGLGFALGRMPVPHVSVHFTH